MFMFLLLAVWGFLYMSGRRIHPGPDTDTLWGAKALSLRAFFVVLVMIDIGEHDQDKGVASKIQHKVS